MGYMAARGGLDAIRAAEELVKRKRMSGCSAPLETSQVVDQLRYAVDRVMSEGGLWAEEVAARSIRQVEGDVIEAAQLVRSFRSTLPRFAGSVTVHADEIDVLRRIVPAYRELPGPQLLGRTLDYTGRLLELDDHAPDPAPLPAVEEPAGERVPGRLMDLLRALDLLTDRRRDDDPEPDDITRTPAAPGAPRSTHLSVMARAETGALINLWYRNIMGPDSHLHEVTLGEVRHGRLPVAIHHPHTGGRVVIGHVRVTEVEAIEDLDGLDEDRTRFDVGYGLCLGHNERKAIAMANLDIAVHRDRDRTPLSQSVLMTTDGLDASGFIEHLKLPHYVTFRSMVERKEARRSDRARAARRIRMEGVSR